jgi:hypothetical protein
MRRGGRAAAGVSLACAALAASAVLCAAPAVSAQRTLTGPAPGPTPTDYGDPADPFGPAPGPADGGAGSGPSSVGQVTGAVVAPLFDRLRLAAAYVVGSNQPAPTPSSSRAAAAHSATGAGGSAWKPPSDLRAPKVVSVPAGSANGPAALTTDQILWAAYVSASKAAPASCHIPVTLLAAIGEVESSSLRGRSLDARHDVVPPVIGPALSGNGFAAIGDTDGGRLDGDPVWDHAVGPMQFIPSTWRAWGADANGDGVADPQNIEDATLASARYLCAGGKDLSRGTDLARAVLSYNGSQRYLATVIGLMDAMTSGADAAP